jgi:hypothetical protein
MTLFKEYYHNGYFQTHNIPLPVNSLDPRVFTFQEGINDPLLVPGVRAQILYDIQSLNEVEDVGSNTRVLDYILIGQILEQNADKTCPVNILAQINPTNLQDLLKERLLNKAKELSGKLLPGTTHPVVYQLTEKPFNLQTYASVYHPFRDTWIKRPRFLGA